MADEHKHDHEHGHEHGHDHEHHRHLRPGEFASAKPILNVKDVAASLRYYIETLGFELAFAWCPEGSVVPTFGEVVRGAAMIMLAQNDQGGPGMWIYVDVPTRVELDRLHAEYTRRGARIAQPPEDRPWGRREMRVHDLDGHTLRLGAPLEHGHG
jgi:uncharacterized glyoxalase superfamily protein PhnB